MQLAKLGKFYKHASTQKPCNKLVQKIRGILCFLFSMAFFFCWCTFIHRGRSFAECIWICDKFHPFVRRVHSVSPLGSLGEEKKTLWVTTANVVCDIRHQTSPTHCLLWRGFPHGLNGLISLKKKMFPIAMIFFRQLQLFNEKIRKKREYR